MTILLVKDWNPILQDTDKDLFPNGIKHDSLTPPNTMKKKKIIKVKGKFTLKKNSEKKRHSLPFNSRVCCSTWQQSWEAVQFTSPSTKAAKAEPEIFKGSL